MATSSSSTNSSSNGDPWGWLGLLKWSLAYTDGTKPSSEATPMSAEDKAFLETVMKEGIIDESERMKTILKEVTVQMDAWRRNETYTKKEADTVQDLLQEVRDICEQIDYARAFSAMKGLSFLLGCVQEAQRNSDTIPRSVQLVCLGLIATLCQHNPPVQKELLELGSVRTLSDLYFSTNDDDDANGQLRARIIQAISANVRSHALAETVFCALEQAPRLLTMGLESDQLVLKKRTLFFLRAILTSDATTRARVRRFAPCLVLAVDSLLLQGAAAEHCSSADPELIEISLQMVEQVLHQRRSVNAVLSRKDALARVAVERVAALRTLTGEDGEYAAVELGLWEQVLVLLARATPDVDDES